MESRNPFAPPEPDPSAEEKIPQGVLTLAWEMDPDHIFGLYPAHRRLRTPVYRRISFYTGALGGGFVLASVVLSGAILPGSPEAWLCVGGAAPAVSTTLAYLFQLGADQLRARQVKKTAVRYPLYQPAAAVQFKLTDEMVCLEGADRILEIPLEKVVGCTVVGDTAYIWFERQNFLPVDGRQAPALLREVEARVSNVASHTQKVIRDVESDELRVCWGRLGASVRVFWFTLWVQRYLSLVIVGGTCAGILGWTLGSDLALIMLAVAGGLAGLVVLMSARAQLGTSFLAVRGTQVYLENRGYRGQFPVCEIQRVLHLPGGEAWVVLRGKRFVPIPTWAEGDRAGVLRRIEAALRDCEGGPTG